MTFEIYSYGHQLITYSLQKFHGNIDRNNKMALIGDISQVALPVMGGGIAFCKGDYKAAFSVACLAIINQIAIESLKTLIPEVRPNGRGRSFPSGHTASAFMGATFIINHFGLKAGVPAFAVATLVGYSRIHCRAHWKVDVVCGAILGIAVAQLSSQMETQLARLNGNIA